MLELSVKFQDEVYTLQFEHSLRSVSKWESKACKPFLSSGRKNALDMIDYFECMLMTPDVDSKLVYALAPDQLESLRVYIDTPQVASPTPPPPKRGPSKIVTSILMYHWMVALKINWEAQDWHLSRFQELVQVHGDAMNPPKKGSNKQIAAEWDEINERQKALLKTSG